MKYMFLSFIVLCLAACGGEGDEPKFEPADPPAEVIPETPGDKKDDDMNKEQTKIKILIGDMEISGYLNNTLTAREMASRLPFTATVSKGKYDFCGTAENLPADPKERQAGWKNGDIGYSNGWLALFHSGEEESSSYTSEMIVGHMDDAAIPELRRMNGTYKVTISIPE